jgi:ubiquinone/menaquinone biosynthesis C-methylase UbiE
MTTEDRSQGWDRHARTYARIASPFTGYIAQNLFQTVAGRLPPAPRILEIACGNGELSRAALLHCLAHRKGAEHEGSVVATDISKEMVHLAQQTSEFLGRDDLMRFDVQDGQALSFDASSFDAVFSAFGIFLFPDRCAGWREAARVLRPGGYLATAVWRGPEDNPLARLQMAPIMAALPEHVRAALPRPSWLDIATRDGLTQEIANAGFRDIEVSVFDAALTAATPRAMWEFMQDNPLTHAVLASCTETELAAVESSVLTSFEALAGAPDRSLRFDASCHFAVARRM